MNDPIDECKKALELALLTLRQSKPTERTEVARRFAVTITELEKTIAYFETWIVNEQEIE